MPVYAIIVTILLLFVCFVGLVGWKRYYGYIDFFNKQRNQYRHMLRIYDMWTCVGQKGLKMADYLMSKNDNKIVIYGMDIMGLRIYEGLRNTEVEVIFGIKNKSEGIPCDLKMMEEEDCSDLSEVSVIITDFFNYYEIEERLKNKGAGRIYSLDEILTNMLIEAQGNLGDIGYGIK